MRRTRRVWWKAAGLLLAATAASPALAQALPAGTTADDLPAGYPPPTTTPIRAACPAGEGRWPWQRGHDQPHASCQAHMWGYASEFEAPPLGATIHAHFRTMAANGTAAAMMLYRYDFIQDSNVLNLRGRDQLTRIAVMLQGNNFPIVIERTPEAPAVAEARRALILNVLAHNGIAVPPERVVIGPPIAHGLTGAEAEVLYGAQVNSLLIQSQPLPAAGLSGRTSSAGSATAGAAAGTGAGGVR